MPATVAIVTAIDLKSRIYRSTPPPAAGSVFGQLTVVAEAERHPLTGRRQITCTCKCGQTAIVILDSLRRGQTVSCGCLSPRKKQLPDPEVGAVFGRWRVLGAGQLRLGKSRTMRCRCECGTVRDVRVVGLRSGKSAGCGCHERSFAREARLRAVAVIVEDLPESVEDEIALPVAKVQPTVTELLAKISDLEARLLRAREAEESANRRIEILEQTLQGTFRQRYR